MGILTEVDDKLKRLGDSGEDLMDGLKKGFLTPMRYGSETEDQTNVRKHRKTHRHSGRYDP